MSTLKTLKDELLFEGIGLHSGVRTSVRLIPNDSYGVFFKTASGIYPISSAVVEEDMRLTGFFLPDGSKVRTAEHLLGTIVGMGLNSIIIMVENEEVPIMDGSASEFAQAIYSAGYETTETTETGSTDSRDVASAVSVADERRGSMLTAYPSDKLRITYIIDYTGTPIGTQRADYFITPETYLETISKARTFGLVTELEYLKEAGLIRGGSLANALVFDDNKLLNEGGLRFPLEPVTHKVTDLLGDLLLLGYVPKAHYMAVCAGHALHGKLVRKLKRIS